MMNMIGEVRTVDGGFVIQTRLAENIPDTYELFVDASVPAGDSTEYSRREQERKAESVLRILDESAISYRSSVPEAALPNTLRVGIGFQRQGYGVYGLQARMRWPELSDEEASRRATQAMQAMARTTRLLPEHLIDTSVYAHFSRRRGVDLETNPAGASGLGTSGQDYTPHRETISLYGGNLYSHRMQLVCISGLLAVAQRNT